MEFYKQDDLPKNITIDRELLFRAIMNIISNAIDYSTNQSKLYFDVLVNQRYLKFVITDCGRGFSKEDLSKATEQFYTGDSVGTLNLIMVWVYTLQILLYKNIMVI